MSRLNKNINFVKQILTGRITRKRIPILVVLCVTHRCNLNCAYCYEDYYDRNQTDFTTAEILTLIDELHAMGTKLISINGGEALMRGDIDNIVDKVKSKNILCQLATNGLLIKKKISTVQKVDSLCVSIDGNKQSNDANRGAGSFDKIIDGIECLKQSQIKFHSNTVITKNNQNAVDEILELARKYDFKAQFSILRPENDSSLKLYLNDGEIRKTLKRILNYKKKGYPVFFSQSAYQAALNWPVAYSKQMIFIELPRGYKTTPCYLKEFSCHIEANGFVYPCVVLVNKFKSLNIREVGFKKAWEHLSTCECKACYNICHNDLNRIFGLRHEAMWNAFKLVINRIGNLNSAGK